MQKNTIDYRSGGRYSIRGYSFSRISSLILGTIVCNIFRLFIKIIDKNDYTIKKKDIKKIIVLGFGGIGNHLMILPTISALKKFYPGSKIHFNVASNTCAKILNENPDIDQISVKNFTKSKHLKKIFRLGRSLRAERPNIFLAAAGTDPLVGSIIAFLSGAKIRIGENWKGRGFLYTHYLNVNYNVTEKDQNINLIKQLNIPAKQSLPKIYLTDFEKEAAENWLFSIKKNVEAKILGIHPGSGKGQSWKRWNINNFIKVGKTIAKQNKAIVVFFFGPDDRNLRNKTEKELLGSSIIINGNDGIRETAAKISCCDIFFSNDSGLRQIAVALNINTIGIFGPTSIKKNFLYDEKHKIIHDKSVYCSPCHYTKWWLNCNGKRPCLNRISVKIALDCINNLL